MQAKLMQRLHLDHQRMAKILVATEQLAKDMRRAEMRSSLDKLLCVLEYINEYPEQIHHPFEDKLFAHLLACDITPEEREQVEANAARHKEMESQSSALLQGLMRPVKTQKVTELRASLKEFVEVQREHMRFEESTVFPMAERYLPESVWEALDSDYDSRTDPLFDANEARFEAIFGYVVDQPYGTVDEPAPVTAAPRTAEEAVTEASQEMVNEAGLMFEAADKLAAVGWKHMRVMFEDWQESMAKVGSTPPPMLAMDHFARRATHTVQHFMEGAEIWQAEAERLQRQREAASAAVSGRD